METNEPSELTLKWGTLKGWSNANDECMALLKEYHEDPVSWGCATQSDTNKQKDLLLKMVDAFDLVYLDWDGEYVSKEKAKEYIRNYRK